MLHWQHVSSFIHNTPAHNAERWQMLGWTTIPRNHTYLQRGQLKLIHDTKLYYYALTDKILQLKCRTEPTMCNPLLWMTPSCSMRFRDIVMEGRSKLWGGNWGVKSFPCAVSWSPRPWKGSRMSAIPSAGSDSGGGVIGGISNSSSPRLGVWNVC